MELMELFKAVVSDDDISDLHLTVDMKPVVRKNGELQAFEAYPEKIDIDKLREINQTVMDEEQLEIFEEKGELDFSYSIPELARFRVNAYHQRGFTSLALRIIPTQIPTVDELGLPDILKKLAMQRKGLVLTTGPTGSGKSTTLAAMINEINVTQNSHILTLEDPIEYLHKHKKCIVHQREVGVDTQNFANGLRAALRQDPDVILVGEMRDLETISIALEAAETGHLVFATLHTSDAPSTIDRIIDVFPAHQQQQVRIQLSSALNGVISQQLLPKKGGSGRVAAIEVLIGTAAVRNIIREGKSSQLETTMQTGAKYGMIVLNNYLLNLYKKGLIDKEMAVSRSSNPDYIKKRLTSSR